MSDRPIDLCLYHDVDLDGQCSAAICRLKHPGCELVGLNYGEDIPWERLTGKRILMADFSFQPWGKMARLLVEAENLVWIDHHKSAVDSWAEAGSPFIAGLRRTDMAACELTWKWLFPDTAIPYSVFLLGDYDCWRHSDEHTMAFQMGMRSYDVNPRKGEDAVLWNCVLGAPGPVFHRIIEEGRSILRYSQRQDARAASSWFPVRFDDKLWMAVNRGGVNSKLWDTVWDPVFDGKLSFCRIASRWLVSLYSETVDCDEIAKRHGGGGHAGAAGFHCTELPFSISCQEKGPPPHMTTDTIFPAIPVRAAVAQDTYDAWLKSIVGPPTQPERNWILWRVPDGKTLGPSWGAEPLSRACFERRVRFRWEEDVVFCCGSPGAVDIHLGSFEEALAWVRDKGALSGDNDSGG